jgi:UDP-glucose 4-epimerase
MPLTIVGDGTQTRDFTYVSDVVDAFFLASTSKIGYGIFNVGSGNTYSINELAELIGGLKVHIPKRPGEPDSTYANINEISSKLSWKPKITFKEGMKMVLSKISEWSDAPVWSEKDIEKETSEWFRLLKGHNEN